MPSRAVTCLQVLAHDREAWEDYKEDASHRITGSRLYKRFVNMMHHTSAQAAARTYRAVTGCDRM